MKTIRRIQKRWEEVPEWIKDIIGLIGLLYALFVFANIMGYASWK